MGRSVSSQENQLGGKVFLKVFDTLGEKVPLKCFNEVYDLILKSVKSESDIKTLSPEQIKKVFRERFPIRAEVFL